ncbi:MAG: type II secretion system protein N [Janthinobacterium lividum]
MRLVLDARARRWVRRLPAVNAYSAAELALLAGLAVQTARLVWAMVTPIGPLGDWRPAEPTVAGSAAAVLTGFDPFFRVSGAAGAAPATVTQLQLKLFGTRIDEASGRGSAIVAGPDGVQRSIAVGEEIVGGVKLKSVAFDHVTLDRGGRAEDLYLDQSGGASAGASPVAAQGAGAAPLLPTPSALPGAVPVAQLRADVGFSPRLDGGRLTGLTVHPQGAGTAFRAAGLRDGDVVTSIGGRPATGAADLDRIATDFAGGGILPVTVERGGQPTALSIPIAPK